MSPTVKYTLGRIGLFLFCALALWPVPMNLYLKLMLAVLASAGLAYFLLRSWRDQMANQVAEAVTRRRAERERLRSALAGDTDEAGDASAPDAADGAHAAEEAGGPDAADGDADGGRRAT